MGASHSQERRPSGGQSQYLIRVGNDFPHFLLCFRRPLTATLFLHNKQVLLSLEESIRKRWPTNGIKKTVLANPDGSAEIQLAEETFRTLADLLDSWKPELIFNFKRFLCAAFTDFKSIGWRVALSTDTWTRYPSLSTLIFEQCPATTKSDSDTSASASIAAAVFAISLSFEGNVLLVNASERLKEAFRELVQKWYPPGVQETVSYGNDIRYRLSGSPWTAWPGDQSIRLARRLLLQTFHRFYEMGCKFYCNMNTVDFGDCLFFDDESATIDEQPASLQKSQFMCLTFYNENKIHLIASSEMTDRLEQIICDSIKAYWHLGLKSIVRCQDDQSYEITLNGTPFVIASESHECDASSKFTPDDSSSWQARFFLCHLFQNLLARGGWRVEAAFDAHRKNYDTATYIFKQRSEGQTAILQHACLAFDRSNLVRLVNDVNGDLAPLVRQAIKAAWSKGLAAKETRVDDVKGYEMKLSGHLWLTCLDGVYTNSNLDSIAAQTLACLLYNELKKAGWRVTASASTCCLTLGRGRHKQRTTADTWILVRSEDNYLGK